MAGLRWEESGLGAWWQSVSQLLLGVKAEVEVEMGCPLVLFVREKES